MIMIRNRRMLTYLSVALASVWLAACGATLSHRGKSETIGTYSDRSGAEIQFERCRAVCRQIEPNGRCVDWIRHQGQNCVEELR